MEIKAARTLFLRAFLACLSLTALIGIGVLLTQSFGEVQARILATTSSIAMASVCAMACAAYVDKTGALGVGGPGIGVSMGGLALLLIGIWATPNDEAFWKTVATCCVVSVGYAHALLLLLPTLAKSYEWAQAGAVGAIALLTLMISAAIWGEIDDIGYYTFLGCVSIVVALGTLAVPVLWKLSGDLAAAPPPERAKRKPLPITLSQGRAAEAAADSEGPAPHEPQAEADQLQLTRQEDGSYLDPGGARYRVLVLEPAPADADADD